jgi:hypothetical protein
MRSLGVYAPAIVGALVLAGSPLSAQRKELTVLAGANYSGATGGSLAKSQSRSGFLGGISLRLPRSSQVSFETQFLVVQRRLSGQRAPSSAPLVEVGPISDAPKLLYAEIPLMLRFQQGYSTERPMRPFLTLGPYIGVRLSCERDVVEGDSTMRHTDCSNNPNDILVGTQPLITASYQNVDVGGVAAFGVEIRRMSVAVRIERSIVSLVESSAVATSPFDKSKLWSGSLSIEYLLRVL